MGLGHGWTLIASVKFGLSYDAIGTLALLFRGGCPQPSHRGTVVRFPVSGPVAKPARGPTMRSLRKGCFFQ
jgi:hypothetical protein